MSIKRRTKYRTVIGEARFTDNTTGIHQRLGDTSWYYKNLNNNPGYFLRIGNTFKEFPEACFNATVNKIGEYDFAKVRQEVKKIRANRLLAQSNQINQEVSNESKKSSI